MRSLNIIGIRCPHAQLLISAISIAIVAIFKYIRRFRIRWNYDRIVREWTLMPTCDRIHKFAHSCESYILLFAVRAQVKLHHSTRGMSALVSRLTVVIMLMHASHTHISNERANAHVCVYPDICLKVRMRACFSGFWTLHHPYHGRRSTMVSSLLLARPLRTRTSTDDCSTFDYITAIYTHYTIDTHVFIHIRSPWMCFHANAAWMPYSYAMSTVGWSIPFPTIYRLCLWLYFIQTCYCWMCIRIRIYR